MCGGPKEEEHEASAIKQPGAPSTYTPGGVETTPGPLSGVGWQAPGHTHTHIYLQALIITGVHTPIHATSHAECDNVNMCTLTDTYTYTYTCRRHMQEHTDHRCAHSHMYNYSCRV